MESKIIVGIDEVGLGAVAGPVVSAACFLQAANSQIKDSKKLSPAQRHHLCRWIMCNSKWAIGVIDNQDIDTSGIVTAWNFSVSEAFNSMISTLPHDKKTYAIKIDGKRIPTTLENLNIEAIIKGDTKIKEISAASILAKVWRDNYMINAA